MPRRRRELRTPGLQRVVDRVIKHRHGCWENQDVLELSTTRVWRYKDNGLLSSRANGHAGRPHNHGHVSGHFYTNGHMPQQQFFENSVIRFDFG